ncbi:hypothetical protein OQA88_6693 [Cercophora sp. LCS_1]
MASSSGSQTTYLSPLDQYMPRVDVRVFLIFASPSPSDAIKTIQAGLDVLASQLPFLKGTVTLPPPSEPVAVHRGRVAITTSPTDTPITLLHIPSSVGTTSFSELKASGAPISYFHNTFPQLLDARRAANPTASGAPVFAASYALLDEGVVLGVATHHAVADGTGVSELIKFWGACTRGEMNISPRGDEVFIRDELLWRGVGRVQDDTEKRFGDVLKELPEFCVACEVAGTALSRGQALPKGATALFTFDITRLEAARDSLKGKVGDEKALTTNNVLCAVVWACVTKARLARKGGSLGAERSKLGFAVNGRRMLGHKFAEGPYLGNVNLFGVQEVDVEILADIGSRCHATADLSSITPLIESAYEATRRVTASHIGQVMTLMDQAEDVRNVVPNWVRSYGPDLSVTSWANMGLYESDFGAGLGHPEFMRTPYFESDGLIVVLPRKRVAKAAPPSHDVNTRTGENIEVVAVLCHDDIEVLKKDDVWKSWVA